MAEIESIVGHAKSMGITCEVVVAPGLVYHPDRFRGMVCTVVRRRKGVEKVVAAGGRWVTFLRLCQACCLAQYRQ